MSATLVKVGTTVRLKATLHDWDDATTVVPADFAVTFTIDDGNTPAPSPITGVLQGDGSYVGYWTVTDGHSLITVTVTATVAGYTENETICLKRRRCS